MVFPIGTGNLGRRSVEPVQYKESPVKGDLDQMVMSIRQKAFNNNESIVSKSVALKPSGYLLSSNDYTMRYKLAQYSPKGKAEVIQIPTGNAMTMVPKEDMRKSMREMAKQIEESATMHKLQANDISLPHVKVIVKNASI